MNKRKDNMVSYIGRAMFVLLFFILVYIISGNSVKQNHNAIQNELSSFINPSPSYAIVTEQVKPPSYQTSWVSLPDNCSFKHFDIHSRINTANLYVAQKYLLLQKTLLKIKPLTNLRFYYSHSSKDTEEPPILS